jgi:hypothetical protein
MIYIDDMYKYPMGEFRRGGRLMKMSHLIADTDAELHRLAQLIGIQRRWHQGDHYDVSLQYRGKAINMGAVEITLRQCSAMMMLRRFGVAGKLAKPEEAEALLAAHRAARKTESA